MSDALRQLAEGGTYGPDQVRRQPAPAPGHDLPKLYVHPSHRSVSKPSRRTDDYGRPLEPRTDPFTDCQVETTELLDSSVETRYYRIIRGDDGVLRRQLVNKTRTLPAGAAPLPRRRIA